MIEITHKRTAEHLIDKAWFRIAQKPENLDRREDFMPCFICGLPVDGAKSKWIHVINGGSHAAEPGDVIDPAGDMYLHPIGPDCLRRQPRLKPVATKKGVIIV